jgi:hypothetical protein
MMRPVQWIMAVVSAVMIAGCAHEPPAQAGMEQWSNNHPAASQELGVWVQTHPQAAARFFEWDGHHPQRAHEFVTWTIYHPAQPIEGFVATHPGWQYFDQIALNHRAGADAFMAWCRRHAQAAEALMNHPGGLNWAGHHLYASSWHMDNPGQ